MAKVFIDDPYQFDRKLSLFVNRCKRENILTDYLDKSKHVPANERRRNKQSRHKRAVYQDQKRYGRDRT